MQLRYLLLFGSLLFQYFNAVGQESNPGFVNLNEYNIPFKIVLPAGARVDHNEFSTNLMLSSSLSVSILQYQKAEWDFNNSYNYHTLDEIVQSTRAEKESEIENILEENDHLLIVECKGTFSFYKPYWIGYFIESDESIYQFSSYAQTRDEIEKIKGTLQGIVYIDPCPSPVHKIQENDQIIDFAEFKYPVRISFSSDVEVLAEKTIWGAKVKPRGQNYFITMDQFVFGNNLEQSIVERKSDRQADADFLSFVRDEEQGYIIERKDFGDRRVYEIYYFHLSDEYYYKFGCYYRSNMDSQASRDDEIHEAIQLYERLKGASIPPKCQ